MGSLENINQGQLLELAVNYGTKAVGFLVLLFITFKVAGWVQKLSWKAMNKSKLDEGLSKFLSKLVRYAILVTGLISCLGIFGIQTASFAAILAAAGFAIGMALQGTLGNFASGVMILTFKPFKIDDVISVAGATGKVVEIDMFSTALDTPDNRRLIVPNGSVFGQNIENMTFHQTRRVDITVGTDYGADLDQARKIMLEAASGVTLGLKDPAAAVILANLGDSSIEWSVRLWTKTEDYWTVKDQLTRDVKYALDQAKIGIPFPQMDLHFDAAVANSFARNKIEGQSTQPQVQ